VHFCSLQTRARAHTHTHTHTHNQAPQTKLKEKPLQIQTHPHLRFVTYPQRCPPPPSYLPFFLLLIYRVFSLVLHTYVHTYKHIIFFSFRFACPNLPARTLFTVRCCRWIRFTIFFSLFTGFIFFFFPPQYLRFACPHFIYHETMPLDLVY